MTLNQNKIAVVEAMFVEVLVCVLKPGNIHDQYTMEVGKNRTVKAIRRGRFMYLYSISEERQSYSLQSITGRQNCSVDLSQGGIRVELRYSGTIFVVF